jgi:Ca2+-binding RTX toxin-like protein
LGGNDFIWANDPSVPSVLRGGGGNDNLSGSDRAADTLKGGPGDDYLDGGWLGTDYGIGGGGNDSFLVSGSNSRYEGGTGNDTFRLWDYLSEGNGATIYGGDGTDTFGNDLFGCRSASSPGGIGTQITVTCPRYTVTVSTSSLETNLFPV